jgi:hypothetical protein
VSTATTSIHLDAGTSLRLRSGHRPSTAEGVGSGTRAGRRSPTRVRRHRVRKGQGGGCQRRPAPARRSLPGWRSRTRGPTLPALAAGPSGEPSRAAPSRQRRSGRRSCSALHRHGRHLFASPPRQQNHENDDAEGTRTYGARARVCICASYTAGDDMLTREAGPRCTPRGGHPQFASAVTMRKRPACRRHARPRSSDACTWCMRMDWCRMRLVPSACPLMRG